MLGRLHGRISNVRTFVLERVARWLACSVSVVVTIAIACLGRVMLLFGYIGTFAAFGYSGTTAHALQLGKVDSNAGNRRDAARGSSRALFTGRPRGGAERSLSRRGALHALVLCALLTKVDAGSGSHAEADG